jgi:hypothetical protein
MTIHWNALEEHFLMATLVFRFNFMEEKFIFFLIFLNPTEIGNLTVCEQVHQHEATPSESLTN